MSDYIDTREGWREVPSFTDQDFSSARLLWTEPGSTARCWVREVPVPPLPTAMYTSIKVVWRDGPSLANDPALTLRNTTAGPRWWNEQGPHRPDWLAKSITDFEVLAEPGEARFSERAIRKATARAVLDRVRDGLKDHDNFDAGDLHNLALEFGAES